MVRGRVWDLDHNNPLHMEWIVDCKIVKIVVKTFIGLQGYVWSEGWVWNLHHNGGFTATLLNSQAWSLLKACLCLFVFLQQTKLCLFVF